MRILPQQISSTVHLKIRVDSQKTVEHFRMRSKGTSSPKNRMTRAVVFRVAQRKSSRFSSRASRQINGVLHVQVWYRSTPEEAVGFELSV